MSSFRVSWEIDVDVDVDMGAAESAIAAARKARKIQLDPLSQANVFEVCVDDGVPVTVDLHEIDQA